MAVTTTKNMDSSKKKKATPKKAAPQAAAKPRLIYEFPSAPMGDCKVSFFHQGETVTLSLHDKRYEIREKDERKVKAWRDMLVAAGFVDKSYVEPGAQKKEKPKKKYRYTYGHPDNSPDEYVQGKVSITVDGKDHTFEVVDGLVETEDEAVAQALEDRGFYPNSREELE